MCVLKRTIFSTLKLIFSTMRRHQRRPLWRRRRPGAADSVSWGLDPAPARPQLHGASTPRRGKPFDSPLLGWRCASPVGRRQVVLAELLRLWPPQPRRPRPSFACARRHSSPCWRGSSPSLAPRLEVPVLLACGRGTIAPVRLDWPGPR